MAVSKYDWDFISPLDQTANIAALSQGNQQINAGLQGVSGAVTGYADAIKQRNTDSILNALSQAQTSAQLPDAMNAVQALQQQYGRGYDQTAVRNAIDTRGSTLGQRDLQAINLQQAQAAQAALPQLNQSAALEAIRQGANPDQVNALTGLGIDATGQISRYGTNAQGDTRYTAEGVERKFNRAEDVAYRNQQAKQQQENWKADSEFRTDESNWKRGGDVAQENPASSNLVFQDGKWATVNTPKISRVDAYGALSGLRGIRNNNPGNIDFYNQPGASIESKGGRFARFSTPEQGIYAMSKQLDLYYTGKSRNVTKPINTIQDIITTWAPPTNKKGQVENNTAVYIAAVAKSMGVAPTAKLNLLDPNTKAALMSAMITQENGGDPYTPAQYAAGISGKRGATAQSASQAINIPQSVAANAVSKYSGEITKLQNDFNLTTAKDQGTTTLGSKGQTIDSWLASQPVTDREGSTIFTDYASKVSKVARNNAKLSNLPMDSQLKVLDATHAWALAPGGVITDKELNKHIDNLVGSITTSNKRNLDQGRKNIFETQYQAFVADLNKAGKPAVDRDAFRALVDPQSVKPAPVKAPPVVKESTNPFGEPSTATKAVQAVAPNKINQVPAKAPTKAETDKRIMEAPGTRLTPSEKQRRNEIMAERQQASKKQAQDTIKKEQENLAGKRAEVAKADADRKVREREAANQRAKERLAKEQANKQNKGTPKAPTNAMFKGIGSTGSKTLSQAELNEILKKLKTG